MKKSKYILLLLLVSLIVNTTPLAAAADEGTLTLQEAKELAVKNSVEVQQYQLNIAKADKAKRDADDAYSKVAANYFTEAQETMVVNAREAYRAALNAYNDSKILYENIKTGLEYDVENLYLTILNAENELKVLEYDLRMQADLAKIERLKLEMGMSTENKVRQAEIALDSLHSSYNMKNSQLKNYKAAMNRYIGRDPNKSLQLDTAVQLDLKKEIATVDEAYKIALANYLAINQYNRTISEKEKDKDWYGYNQSDKVENLNNSIKEAKINKENAEKALKQSITNIYDKISLNQRNITNVKTNLEVAQKNNEYDQQKYQLGMLSALELKNSQKALEQAKKDSAKAEFDYYLALRELELAEKGIILAANMK